MSENIIGISHDKLWELFVTKINKIGNKLMMRLGIRLDGSIWSKLQGRKDIINDNLELV
jgi:hypothetical protein